MKAKKLLSILCLGFTALAVASCNAEDMLNSNSDNNPSNETTENYTKGLGYSLLEDGESYEVHGTSLTKKRTKIVIPSIYKGKPVTSIGQNAFYECSAITSITIPDSITSIGNYAFRECSSLESITIPDSVTSIGWNAFEYCESLKSINIPDSVTSIGQAAFGDCSSLTSVTTGNGVTTIEGGTFSGCSSLTSITIGKSVVLIDVEAFLYCTSLSNIVVDEKNTVFDSRNNCNAIVETSSGGLILGGKNTIIPNGVKFIGIGAFSHCSSLTSITIPDSVTAIGRFAFASCSSLESIIIPDSVTVIYEYTFADCSSLETVYYTGTEEQWNAISIDEENEDLTNATIIYNYVSEE